MFTNLRCGFFIFIFFENINIPYQAPTQFHVIYTYDFSCSIAFGGVYYTNNYMYIWIKRRKKKKMKERTWTVFPSSLYSLMPLAFDSLTYFAVVFFLFFFISTPMSLTPNVYICRKEKKILTIIQTNWHVMPPIMNKF